MLSLLICNLHWLRISMKSQTLYVAGEGNLKQQEEKEEGKRKRKDGSRLIRFWTPPARTRSR